MPKATFQLFNSIILCILFTMIGSSELTQAESVPMTDATKEAGKQEEFIGTLQTGVMAIGGETTGILLQGDKKSYELDLNGHADLLASAEKLNGKKVGVTGFYAVKAGVEIKERHIISVKSLKLKE